MDTDFKKDLDDIVMDALASQYSVEYIYGCLMFAASQILCDGTEKDEGYKD